MQSRRPGAMTEQLSGKTVIRFKADCISAKKRRPRPLCSISYQSNASSSSFWAGSRKRIFMVCIFRRPLQQKQNLSPRPYTLPSDGKIPRPKVVQSQLQAYQGIQGDSQQVEVCPVEEGWWPRG